MTTQKFCVPSTNGWLLLKLRSGAQPFVMMIMLLMTSRCVQIICVCNFFKSIKQSFHIGKVNRFYIGFITLKMITRFYLKKGMKAAQPIESSVWYSFYFFCKCRLPAQNIRVNFSYSNISLTCQWMAKGFSTSIGLHQGLIPHCNKFSFM